MENRSEIPVPPVQEEEPHILGFLILIYHYLLHIWDEGNWQSLRPPLIVLLQKFETLVKLVPSRMQVSDYFCLCAAAIIRINLLFRKTQFFLLQKLVELLSFFLFVLIKWHTPLVNYPICILPLPYSHIIPCLLFQIQVLSGLNLKASAGGSISLSIR